MVEGSGLENRQACQSVRGFESHPLRQLKPTHQGLVLQFQVIFYDGVLAESAEGARLLSEYTAYTVSRVRISHTPPFFVPLAQLDRAFDYESKGRGFESLRARQNKTH